MMIILISLSVAVIELRPQPKTEDANVVGIWNPLTGVFDEPGNPWNALARKLAAPVPPCICQYSSIGDPTDKELMELEEYMMWQSMTDTLNAELMEAESYWLQRETLEPQRAAQREHNTIVRDLRRAVIDQRHVDRERISQGHVRNLDERMHLELMQPKNSRLIGDDEIDWKRVARTLFESRQF